MNRDWLLVETLGTEPVVVAQGRQMKNLVPISTFLRRNPNLAAIQTAITETVATAKSLASITANQPGDPHRAGHHVRRAHSRVQVWSGPAEAEPPERPVRAR
jgi:hypothetical protein